MALEMLKGRLPVLLLASIVAWIFGITAILMASSELPAFFAQNTPLSLLVITIFSFSFLFFGYPAPFIMFLGGMFAGVHIKTAGIDSFSAIVTIVSLMAAYSSVRLGDALLDDMIGKGNFKQAVKISIILIIVALVISAAIDLSGGI